MSTDEKKKEIKFSDKVEYVPLSPEAQGQLDAIDSILNIYNYHGAGISRAETLGLRIQPHQGKALRHMPKYPGYCLVFEMKNNEFGYRLKIGKSGSIIITDSTEEPESYINYKDRYDKLYGKIDLDDEYLNLEQILKTLNNNNSNILDECDRIINEEQNQTKANKLMIKYLMTKRKLDRAKTSSLNDTRKQELKRGIQCLENQYFNQIMQRISSMLILMQSENSNSNDDVGTKIDSLTDSQQVRIYNRMLKMIREQEENLLRNFKAANIEYYITTDELEKYVYVIIGCGIDIAETWAAAHRLDVPIEPKEAVKLGKTKEGIC